MNLRKEPVLFLVVLALCAWMWTSRSSASIPTQVRPSKDDLPSNQPVAVALAEAQGGARIPPEDLFREPSEAAPLPPTRLEYPPLGPLPVIALPLQPGPESGSYHLLRMDAGPPVPHSFGGAADPGAANGASAEDDEGGDELDVPQGPIGELSAEVLRQRYDRLRRESSPSWFYGRILNQDKLDLVGRAVLPPIQFDWVSNKTGEIVATGQVWDDVSVIELADSLENKVALRKKEVDAVGGPPGIPGRIEFIRFLLAEGSNAPWVFQEAVAQAREIIKADVGNELGFRWLVRVLRAEGDLAAEFELYQGLEGAIAESSFRYRNQGKLEARLTLWADAEAHLRKAVEVAPTDGRSLAALAQYLLDRGRAEEALPFAQRAERVSNTVQPDEDRVPVLETIAAVHLAAGGLEDAADVASRIGSAADPAAKAYLRGCIAYARGDLDSASSEFERAAAAELRFDATLGLAATRLRQARWDDAKSLFERVRDAAPALRARALAGLALLYERTGNLGLAREALDAALLADPRDPYIRYLEGRVRRLSNEYDAALDSLRASLALRDDMTEAFAEGTRALVERADAQGDATPELIAAAVRFADRTVELDRRGTLYVPYIDMLGYVRARVGEVNDARAAFQEAAANGSRFAQIGLAILDYRQKRSNQARDRLLALATDPVIKDRSIPAFAQSLVDVIDDHASKVQIRDDFERDLVGGFWDSDGALRPSIQVGKLEFQGITGRGGEASKARRKAIAGGEFLSVETTMQVREGGQGVQNAALEIAFDGSRNDLRIALGFRRGSNGSLRPEAWVEDGASAAGADESPIVDLSGKIAADPSEPQRLKIEVVPAEIGGANAGPAANQLGLRLYWNDELVHQVDRLKRLTARTPTDLVTALVVQGRPVHVTFDDYRLVRRKSK